MKNFNSNNNPTNLQEQLTQLFDRIDYRYTIECDDQERFILKTNVNMESFVFDCICVIHKKNRIVHFFYCSPISMSKNKMLEIYKFLDHINGSTYIGSVNLRHDNREIISKLYFIAEKEIIDQELLEFYLFEPVRILNYYMPLILKINYGDKDALSLICQEQKEVNPTDN